MCCVSNEVGGDLIGNAYWSGILIRELPKLVGDGSRLDPMLRRLQETKQGAERVKTIVRDLQTFTRRDEPVVHVRHRAEPGPSNLEAARLAGWITIGVKRDEHIRLVPWRNSGR